MTDRVPVGAAADIPDRECVAAADGRVVVVRVGDRVCAYRNRCLHQDAPLAGGWVRDGVLNCPLHFWRYRVDDGALVSGGVDRDRQLESFPVEVVDGQAYVLLPEPPAARSLRDQLLERAAGYDRDREFERRNRI